MKTLRVTLNRDRGKDVFFSSKIENAWYALEVTNSGALVINLCEITSFGDIFKKAVAAYSQGTWLEVNESDL